MKYLGAVIIFLCACTFGIYAGKEEKQRLKECEAFLTLFEYVKNRIGYFLTPTKLIYRGFSDDVLEKTGFLAELRSHENDDIYFDAWESAFGKCENRFCMNEKEKRIVREFGSAIGKTDGATQMNSFNYCIEQMRQEINALASAIEKNVKIYRILGFTVGAVAAIIIL
ncbi:MAG: stage III sporulation protein AB [Clostridia bacterium]|nr:stage III sporulation protein AB [Clostridia bacterium]